MSEQQIAVDIRCVKCGSSNVTGPDGEDFRDCLDCHTAFPEMNPAIGTEIEADGKSSKGEEIVLYCESLGVYLGSALGLAFWSKLDPVGQTHACTFENEVQAREHVNSWDSQPEGIRCVPVIADQKRTFADENHYASIASCVAAGLPAWNPEP